MKLTPGTQSQSGRTLLSGSLLVLVLTVSISAGAGPESNRIRMASLFWPPYSGERLPEQGRTTQLLHDIFEEAGYDLEVDFLPWSRTIRANREGSGYVGYFPEYYSVRLSDRCQFSPPVGVSPLGFVTQQDSNRNWSSLEELSPYRIGVVQDYINTDAFDQMARAGEMDVEITASDQQNILKVASGRIDMAVIDRNVLAWLLDNDPAMASARDEVKMHPRLLARQRLYVCFRRSPEVQPVIKAFHNAWLQREEAS